jgi:hypothetical protein
MSVRLTPTGYKTRSPHGVSSWSYLQALPVSLLEKVTVIPVSTNGGCHALFVSHALAVLSIFTGVSNAMSVRNYVFRSIREHHLIHQSK